MRVIFVIKDRDREGRQREGKGEGDEGRTCAKEEVHTQGKCVRVKVKRNIKKHSAAFEIHVI